MRDTIDNIRFKVYDISYALRLSVERISDKAKYSALSFLVVCWLAVCGVVFYDSYDYKEVEKAVASAETFETAKDILEQTDLLIRIGSVAQAFDLLAMHNNHFAEGYSKKDKAAIISSLDNLKSKAEEGNIAALYKSKDLAELQPLCKFTGVVAAVDNDPMYGVTYTVSKDGESKQEQVEVVGLSKKEVGSKVVFYGVPKFTSVANPIKVEAYEVKAK